MDTGRQWCQAQTKQVVAVKVHNRIELDPTMFSATKRIAIPQTDKVSIRP